MIKSCKKCEQQVQREERENKIIVSIFSGAYLLLVVMLLVLSSCGSSKEFHVGTGVELSKSNCTGNYINR